MSSNRIISKEATVNGVRIYYRIAGSGSPLILLHGSPLTSRSWLRLMPTLAKTYTVVAPDFRGYGQSDKPETGYEVASLCLSAAKGAQPPSVNRKRLTIPTNSGGRADRYLVFRACDLRNFRNALLAMFTIDELERAAETVHRVLPETPQIRWPLLDQRVKAQVWVKHENHTPIGTFKIRGALFYIAELRRKAPEVKGVIAATRGNFGQSVAFAAVNGGLRTVIVVPRKQLIP